MTKEQYVRWSAPYRGSSKKRQAVRAADRMITAVIFCSYPIFLAYLALCGSCRELAYSALIPAASFLAVSWFRKLYSAPRPYEVWDIKPLLKKDTAGKSFPSRHVFSVFVIAMAYFHALKPLGAAAMLLGAALAYIRVLGGVHFLQDVIAGALLGVLSGLLLWIA